MKFSILASLGVNTKAYQQGLDMAKKQTDSFSKKVTKSLKNIALTFGGINIVKNLIQMGMASKETANMFDTVFADSLDRMKEELKALNKVIPETEISIKEALATFRQMANGFGIAGKEANDFAIQMVKIGSDFASFRNLKPDEMFVKLRSAIAGMSRPMMDLGINTQVAKLEQEAFAMGMQFTSGKLSSAQKAYLTMMTTLKQMGVILGDQERTNQSSANQFKHLEKRVKDLGASLGERLLPHLENFLRFSHKMLDFLEKNGKAIKSVSGFLLKLTIATKTANFAFKIASASIAVYKGALFVLSGALFGTVKANMASSKGHKVNTVATNTATIATNRLTLALVKLRMKAMRFPLAIALFILTDYIAKVYEAKTATNALADDTAVDTDEIQKNIDDTIKEMEKYGQLLNKTGALDPYEQALSSGREMIDQTKTLSEQIKQYFDLAKEARDKEMDRLKMAKELQKINAERKGDKERVKELEAELGILQEAEQIMKRHNFSIEMSIQMARELASVRKEDPTNKMLEEQEKKEKELMKLRLEKLRADESGQEKLAKALQRRIDAEERALEIAKEHNITLAEAQDLVRGLIKEENKRSNKEEAEGVTGKDKSGRNLLSLANKLGRDKDIRFERESTSRGDFFRQYKDGAKGALLTKEQLQVAVGEKMKEMKEDPQELETLNEILDTLKGKFKNE